MSENASRSVAVVGVGAVLPDAPNAPTFWENLKNGRYSITETPTGRWDPALYYDPDPRALDKTYSKVGGWVRDYEWSPLEWRLPVPPRVGEAMDRGQKWSVGACREALLDYGYPDRALDTERTAVVLGNAMAGDQHYLTALPIYLPEYVEELDRLPSFTALPASARRAVVEELREAIHRRLPGISEDSMPGELGNIIAGRVANLLDLHGPNFIVDAACASALAAADAAIGGLERGDYDAVLTGGVDANMSASTFVKFCKIGALSATGTRPYHDGADGFVMGEGAAVLLLKRLADAERAGDHIYGVIRGLGGASDGKGKGITAPNPVGQRLAVARAWKDAGRAPDSATYLEGHGTSTKVGDVVEVESLSAVFAGFGLRPGSIPLGSVKSNIGHLKSAAGAAGLLKALYALDSKVIPPSLGGAVPNPNIDFSNSPLYINDELHEWKTEPGQVRSVGVSAFGFGGTNFHAVLEEYVPGRIQPADARKTISFSTTEATSTAARPEPKAPRRGALVIGGATDDEVLARARETHAEAAAGRTPPRSAPAETDLRAAVRLAIDFDDAADLAAKVDRAIKAMEADQPAMWRALRNQGVFMGRGAPAPVAFLFTGQGSQYVNMLATLRDEEPIVADTFAEADKVMTPLLGRPLSDYVFIDSADPTASAAADEQLRQTEITQPAILTVDIALTRLFGAYGIEPEMVMGHSLGEYGALVASGALRFADALEAVSARGREMAHVAVEDCGRMAAVFAPLEEVERTLGEVDGYVVVANVNSHTQAVIGGATEAVEAAVARLSAAGHQSILLPVSHAFHTEIVAPAAEPLKAMLRRLHLESPAIPLVANVNGDFYPMGPNVVDGMIDLLGRQIASPVQFIKGLRTLYDAGCRVFVEVGPKRALQGFVEEVLGEDPDVVGLFSNHPKQGDVTAFNQALCGLYAAGLGVGRKADQVTPVEPASARAPTAPAPVATASDGATQRPEAVVVSVPSTPPGGDTYVALGRMFADMLEKGNQLLGHVPQPSALAEPVVVTGAGLGLPGGERVFGDDKVPAILAGEQLIDTIPVKQREKIVEKHITRLVKTEEGGARFESIENEADVIKLAGRAGALDLVEEFGFPAERAEALDVTSMLAIGAGLDALRDAGIPLVMHYKKATTGRMLQERWMLPEAYRDTTGVVFASAFPGCDSLVGELERYHLDQALRQRVEDLRGLRARVDELGGGDLLAEELDHRIHALAAELEDHPYQFDRKFLFHALSMGHSQFAEYIGARGPNTQVNSACASTTQAVALAEDWIRAGRCERVVIVSGDDVTSDRLLEWVGAGFLASGAAATDDIVAEAAVPFDLRRHGMILGMGAAAIVVEAAGSAERRGLQPIAQVLGTVTANSAFHGTRLDTNHIGQVMEGLVATAERRWGIDRHEIAPHTVFISHETYTPARGGSAQAEVDAIRRVFGTSAGQVVISNTKGFTGHAMGVGVEDVVAIKAIETGIVPPVPNYKVPDPDLGELNLSQGGTYPVQYALRLGAGFGSQVSMTLYRLVPPPGGHHREPDQLGFEYRIVNPDAWQAWLVASCGLPSAVTEIARRTLRIRDDGPPAVGAPAQPAAKSLAGSVTTPRAVDASSPALAQTETPPVPAVAAAPAAAAPAGDEVEARVLDIVAEQTGYPSDLLDLDLDLEADLGIDTVKQAETFAAIRAAYDIERDDRLALRDYPTLRHVIAFVYERAPALTAPPQTETPPVPSAAAAPMADAPDDGLVEGDDAEAAAIPRRIPTAVLRPPLDICQPTGTVLGEGSRVVVMLDDGGSGSALVGRLEERGIAVLAVEGAPDAEELSARLDSFASGGPISGVYWLPALDAEPPIGGLDLAGWRELLRRRVKLLYTTMRHLAEAVGGSGTFLLSATRLGGRHGYDTGGAVAPMGGAVTGFTKAFKRENPDALVKAVDVAQDANPEAVADLLVQETLRDPGAVEVGHGGGERWTVALREVPLGTTPAGIELGPDTVFAITGAAGSIVAAITADLARASHGTFHLLDLIPQPDAADADIVAFGTDKDGLKRTIFERLKTAGERATPALVDKELARIERARTALSALHAVEAAGARVHYHSVDLRDGEAVDAVIQRILEISGHIDVLVHAAGLEVSRRLSDKAREEYDLVFDVKADGWFNLLHGLDDRPLGAAVVFSSVAGRFGNAGQTDYSAANDLLCKEISSLERTRPGTLGIAIDWTAWADIGMATRGSIPTVMKAAGIDMLPARAGIPIVRRELTLRASGGEVVIGQRLGLLADEIAPSGGLDLSPGGPVAERVGDGSALFSTVLGWPIGTGLTVVTTLDPADQPFLHDHQIDGTPVLPGVMGVEAFAEAALLLHPERHVGAIEDVEFLAPFKFYRNEPRQLTVTCQFSTDGDDLLARCALLGTRNLPNQPEPEVRVHFTGTVRLATSPPELAPATATATGEHAVAAEDIYRIYFHGPAYQVLEQAWADDGQMVGRLASGLPPAVHPEHRSLETAPRLLELAFQTAGVWEIGTTGTLNLPSRIGQVVFATGAASEDPITAVVHPGDGEATATVIDDAGRALVELSGYRTIPLPLALDDELVAPLRRACGATG